jgi:tetratricopeptide (TPR) repeat protein
MSGSQQTHRRLSVAMVARDCAEVVGASLESVRDIADEIVVVDTGSQDRTREIALTHASRVLEFDWCDDFAAARNVCLGHVTGDWILWLDAGETITGEDAERLRTLIDCQDSTDRAYLVMVRVPAENHEMADEQIGRIRLHPRRSGMEFTGRVREEIQTAIEALGLRLELAPFVLQRSRGEHDPEIKRRKAERNVHLAALEIQEHGVLPSPLLAMAEACVALDQVTQGIEFFSRALEIAPAGSTGMLEGFYGILSALDQVPQAREQQLALCEQALEMFPLDAQLLCAMGSYLQRQNRLDLACRSYEAAARFGQVDPQTWHLIEIADVASACQAACQELLGDAEGARRNLEAALSAKPTSERLRRLVLDMYIRRDCRQEALEMAEQFAQPTAHRDALRSAVRGACLAAKQNWTPALAYLQTAYGSGCRDTICLRGLVNAYLATGDRVGAERVLVEWRRVQPHSGEAARLERQLLRIGRQPNSAPGATVLPEGAAKSPAYLPLRFDSQSKTPRPVSPTQTQRSRDRLDVNRGR